MNEQGEFEDEGFYSGESGSSVEEEEQGEQETSLLHLGVWNKFQSVYAASVRLFWYWGFVIWFLCIYLRRVRDWLRDKRFRWPKPSYRRQRWR